MLCRCNTPPSLKGRYIGELDLNYFTCYAPVIVEPPTDLNVTEGMAAELKCRASTSLTSISWITPNGSVITHGAYRVRISVLSDGTLNFTRVTAQDTGLYTCLVSNSVGNTTASATLNVTAQECITYFSTITVETVEPSQDEARTTEQVWPTPVIDWDTTNATTSLTPQSTRSMEKAFTIPVTDLSTDPRNR
ncbi:hypothetical protein E2320_021157 [Naja naja]|nr:hypothetical protein E2320_021157 [Naja naja]